ncbi:ADP-ribosylglycohydrolase family protein [Sphingobacterium endophyticum]|uniref:ADP-ribosylglycohydrolase family protein n=1 Tax=Sphingobacterium endophyticum TaxID=2546448 RepID=UPI0012E1DE11|nr:ADP-ribosylglycohydrolase family protein [Sphingobacterium endophyticum]
MTNFKKLILLILILNVCFLPFGFSQNQKEFKISPTILKDKIKGGWAGQTIGVTFGGPTEFRYRGTFIQDYENLQWYDGYIKNTMLNNPHLYDDIYMDLTFVEVMERLGVDASVDSFSNAFAKADYSLWHANQAARFNILNGIKAPESGHWKNNPHADDIDYQIEADFAGLMNPGMPNSASEISDKIGHIMNYGDGWYGGVYVGAMYSLAFLSSDIEFIVNEGLKTIPQESDFYKCIADVIKWHQQYPDNWKQNWFEIQQKWAEDTGCPEGVHAPYNIDAKINAAYVVLGLLYGKGDFTKTLEISTRAGQDSDCNPSTAAGILGAMVGYSNIPEYWKLGLKEAEDIDFKYTKTSLKKVYETSYNQALEMIKKNGGKVNNNQITIQTQQPIPVKFEKSFEGIYPIRKTVINKKLDREYEFDFEGTGFVLVGSPRKVDPKSKDVDISLKVEIDGKVVSTFSLPTNYLTRREEIFWDYDLSNGKHKVKVIQPKSIEGYYVDINYSLIYSDKPNIGIEQHNH